MAELPLLFPWHQDGGLIDTPALRRRDRRGRHDGIWHRAHQLVGLAYRPPRQMRHTFAYLALTGGGEHGKPELRWPLEDVSTQLRHSSIAVTVDYYLDLVPQMLRRTAAQMALGAPRYPTPTAASGLAPTLLPQRQASTLAALADDIPH